MEEIKPFSIVEYRRNYRHHLSTCCRPRFSQPGDNRKHLPRCAKTTVGTLLSSRNFGTAITSSLKSTTRLHLPPQRIHLLHYTTTRI